MERFAIKIDKSLRANLYKICRLCGIDNPDKIKVRDDANIVNLEDGEPELWKKVFDCIGLMITKDDKMPQFMCTLCVDKINDFFEFREMCYATDGQTRKLLGIKAEPKGKFSAPSSSVDFKTEDIKEPIPEVTPQRASRKRRNADMEITGDIKTDITDDIKPSTTNLGNSASKKKRLRLSNITDTETKIEPGTKPTSLTNTKKEPKIEPPTKIPLTKKRLKSEPVVKENKKNMKLSKMSSLMKKKLKVELTPTVLPEAQQSAKKKKGDPSKLKKFPQLIVKTEKLKKGILDTKIKEETPSTETNQNKNPATASSSKTKPKFKETCSICSEGFMNKIFLDKHLKATHIPTIQRYHCVQCNESLKKNLEIKNHNLWHKLSKTPFKCGNCAESSCSIYTYSKHIRDCNQIAYLDTHIPDWHCPDCSGIYETTYLFNIHSCVSKRLVCPGCEKSLKWKEDYFKHIPTCAEAIQRIPPYMTSNIQVKNEAELPTSPIPPLPPVALPTTSIPVVSVPSTTPARIAPPALDSNQCVVIPGNISLHEETGSASPSKSSRKGKRITKKDLKRFDKLLKSTMTTLVSIKHEPQQDDIDGNKPSSSEVKDPNESIEPLESSPESPPGSPMSFGGDDFHHNGDDSNSADEQSTTKPVGTIKQEIIDEGYRDLYNNIEVNIKHENSGEELQKKGAEEPSLAPKPILKLKITKEHGTLNSVLMDSPKSEKKKKKKKRKEDRNRSPDRDEPSVESNTATTTEAVPTVENKGPDEGALAVDTNITLNESSPLASNTTNNLESEVEPSMPLPEIVTIKKEITESETHEAEEEASSQSTPSIVAAFSGSLQISCVSEGVTFHRPEENTEELPQEESIAGNEQTFEEPSDWAEPIPPIEHELTSLCDPPIQQPVAQEPEEEIDIKPRLEDLIPMLQIESVTSIAEVETEPIDKPIQKPVKRKRRPVVAKPDPIPKIVSVSSGIALVPMPHSETEIPVEEDEDASKKEAENNKNDFDFSQVRVKEEIVDKEYDNPITETPDDQQEEVEECEEEMEDDEEEAQDDEEVFENDDEEEEGYISTAPIISKKQEEENAYIANIDFNNLIIKQEKEYIDDGLETSTVFEENEEDDDEIEESEEEEEEEDEDSEESSSEEETDKSDSESEREYRDLPSEDENIETNDEKEKETSTSQAPLGLQILTVHTDVNFSPSNKKTDLNSGGTISCTTEQETDKDSTQPDISNTDNTQTKKPEDCIDGEFELVAERASLNIDDKNEAILENVASNITEQDTASVLEKMQLPGSNIEALKSNPIYSSETNLTSTNLAKVCDGLENKVAQYNQGPDHEEQNVYNEPVEETSLKINNLESTMSIDSHPRLNSEISYVKSPSQFQPDEGIVQSSLNQYYDTAYRSVDSHSPGISARTCADTAQESESINKTEPATQLISHDFPNVDQDVSPQICRTSATEISNELTPLDDVQPNSPPVQSLEDSHLHNASSYPTDDPKPSSIENTPQPCPSLTINHTQTAFENTNIIMDLENANPHHDTHNLTQNESTLNTPTTPMEFEQFNNPGSSYTALNPTSDPSSFIHYQDLTPPTAGQLQTSLVQNPVSNESTELTTNSLTNLSVLTEEVQNLLNEDTVAVNNFEFNDSVLRARSSAPPINPEPIFNDFENLNEIAENNNNANIERELQDELGNVLADAIADRSNDADNVDDDNVMNENRANFDIT